MGVDRSPTLVDAAYLTSPDGGSSPETLNMAQSAHADLQVVLDTFIGRDHASTHCMDTFVKTLTEHKTDLEK